MTKVSIMSVLFVIICAMSQANPDLPKEKKQVQWQETSIVENLMRKDSRPIIIDVFTSWCYYCKVMDATTWKNDSVASYIAEHFYPIKLDAEGKAPIQWEGSEYVFQAKYKVHQLAVKLLRGNMVYPSTVIIPEKGEWQVIPGAISAEDIELVLKYYGSKANERVDFETYQKQFKGQWK